MHLPALHITPFRFLLLVFFVVWCHYSFPQTTVGPKTPSTVDIGKIGVGGNSPWVETGTVTSNDDIDVEVTGTATDGTELSDGVLFSNFGFTSADIPCGSIINGIEVIIEKSDNGTNSEDEIIQLVNSAGTLVGNNKANVGVNWPDADADVTYGNSGDDWAAGLTQSDLISTGFGVVIQYQGITGTNDHLGTIDFVRINITYTAGAPTEIQSDVAGAAENWSSTAAWNPAQLPQACDNVTILTGDEINMDANPGACNNLTIQGSGILNFNTANRTLNVGGNLSMDGTANIDGTAATQDLVVTGNFSVAATATATDIAGIDLTIGGTSNIDGVFTLSSNTGIKTFTGAVTIVGGGDSWTSSAITTTANLVFSGGIANSGTFSASDATFNATQGISGTSALSFSDAVTVSGAFVITNTNTSTVTITGVLNGTAGGSEWKNDNGSTLNYGSGTVPMATGTLNVSTCTNTINYNRAGIQDIKSTTYCNLTCSGGSTKTSLGLLTINGVLNIVSGTTIDPDNFNIDANGNCKINGTLADGNAGETVTLGDAVGDDIDLFGGTIDGSATGTVTINGTVSFSGSSTTNIGRVTLNVNEALTIPSGTTFNFNANADNGVKTFIKKVTINAGGGIWTSSNVPTTGNMIFQNGITQNNGANFTAGGATFNTNAQAVDGSGSLSFANNVTFTGGAVSLDAVGGITWSTTATVITITGITVTNNTTATMSSTAAGTLTGTGTWTQGASSTLNYQGSTVTITTMNASGAGNTVNYNRAGNQTIENTASSPNYINLTLSGASGTKTMETANQDINGNLSIQGGAILDCAGFDINLAGNWDVSSTAADAFVDGSALVIFDGGAAQQIINTSGVANGSIFANIRISNTSGDVTLVSNSATATASLDFTSGKLILGTNNFTLGLAASSGVLSGNSSSLYVVTNSTGYFQRYAASGVATQYPVGISTASGQNLATLTPGDNSTFQVLVDASVTTPNVAARVVNAEWTITRTGGAAATTIKLGWTAGTTTGASFNINDARVVIGRYVGGGSVWNETTNSAKTTADPFDVTATGFTSFSPFAVGSGTAPLPVDLLFFTAKYIQPVSVIEWATASEKNSNSFSVERSSDNSYFEEIGSVTAKGNSSEQNNYSFTDKTPLSGISYYRLKQYDTDGSFTYSKTVSIEVKGKTIEIRKIFPNPMGGETYLDIFSAEETPIQINLINQSGENVQTQKFNLIKGDNLLIMDVNDIGPGIYFIKTDKTDVEKGGNLKKVSVMER